MRKKDSSVGIRLTSEERERLERLAELTQRSKSQVVRLLLALADVQDWPEIALRREGVCHGK